MKITVLYVEDEKLVRKVISELLTDHVENLFVAENGKIGLDLFQKHKPDIVVSDIGMPIMDGLEMASEIKKTENLVPIIITTAHDDVKYLLNAIELGIDQYVLKNNYKTLLIPAIEKSYHSLLIKKRRKAETELLSNVAKVIIEKSPVMVTVTDIDGNVEFVNKCFSDVTGYTLEEIIGKNIGILNEGNETNNITEMWKTIKNGNDWSGVFVNKSKIGKIIKEKAVIIPIKDSLDNILYFVKSAISIEGD